MNLLLALLLIAPSAGAASAAKAKTPKTWDVRLRKYKGDVDVRFSGTKAWIRPERNIPLEQGDEIRVGKKGYAEISFGADSIVHLRADASLVIEDTRLDSPSLYLKFGTLLQKIKSLKFLRKRYSSSGMTWRVRSKAAHAAVRGTEFGVQVSADGKMTAGVFDEGQVDLVSAKGGAVARLKPNNEAAVDPDGELGPVGPLSDLLAYRVHMRSLRKKLLAIQRRYRVLPIQKRRQLREALRKKRLKDKE
ncbi:MAG: FecR domain-containing protein [Elusimicrobiota bacterium]